MKFVVPEPNTGCWFWIGNSYDGYGRFRFRDRGNIGAHRVAWWLLRGPVADELHVDHRCRNRLCVNPDHLQLATLQENLATRVLSNAGRPRGSNGKFIRFQDSQRMEAV